jgi:hypothetical protein
VLTAIVTVSPERFLAGWKPHAATVFVPALSEARLGETAAVRIRIVGQPVHATVFGTVALARRVGRPSMPPGVELALDPESARTAAILAAAARGAEVEFRARPPRWVVERTVVAVRDAVALPARTANVSEAGGSLVWQGSTPVPGEVLAIRLGDGLLAPSAKGVVAWAVAGATGGAKVGVKIVQSGRGARAWAKLAALADRAGALRF